MWRFLRRIMRFVAGPRVGDLVWSATKGTWGKVITTERGGFVTFRHGEETRKGQQRYSTRMEKDQLEWNPEVECWIAGKGPTPKVVRGTVIAPKPVTIRMQPAAR